MSLWGDIISAVGNAAHDIFGGGDSGDNQNQKKQQNNPIFGGQKVSLPSVFNASNTSTNSGPARPNLPVFTPPSATNNIPLTAAPVAQPTVQVGAPVAPQPTIHIADGGPNSAPTPPPPQPTSLFGHLLHGAEDIGKTVASPFAYLGKTDIVDPARELIDSGNPIAEANAVHQSNVDLGLGAKGTNLGSGLEKFAGNSAGALLTAVAPGVDNVIAKGVSSAIPEAAPALVKAFVPKIASNALIGGTFNDAQSVANGQTSPGQLVKNFAVGAGLGGATGGLISAVPVIRGLHLGDNVEATTEAGADLGSTATDEAAHPTPENAPPESGTKAPEEPTPTNAPSAEPGKSTAAPGAPESGVKPLAAPVEPNAVPAPPAAPPEAVPVPADVQAAQDAAQQAVTKTAETVPKPVAAPEAAAPNVTPKQAASEAVAASPEQQVVDEAPNVPDYKTPHKNGKASVPGNSEARYNTGDPNLDAIINDAIIAHKGTAATAGDRADALDQVGITSAQRAQIRNIATKNVDKDTGKISASGVKQIENVIKAPKEAAPAPRPMEPQRTFNVDDGGTATQAEPPTVEPTPTAPAETPTPAQTYNTSLEKTGNAQTDLENAAQAVHDRIENGADFGGNKDAQSIIDEVNGRQQGNQVVAKELADRLDSVLTKEEQANVQDALQNGTVDKLTGAEKEVAQILQQHLNNPADVLRSATDKNYVSGNNYSTQIRQGGGIRSAAKTASNAGGSLKNKVSTFNDLLQQSRFSQARTLGKFTSGKATLFGDPGELGLVAKKDGTFVDKAGKVYNYSHATNQELTDNAGLKFHDLSNSSHTYATDTMNLKARADAANELIKNPEKYGLSETATEDGQPSVTIKGPDGESHEFFTDKGTQKALQEAGVTTGGVGGKANLATTLWNKATTGVVQSIVMNPTVHSMNQLVQGVVASGLEKNGIGGFSFLKNAFNHNVDDIVAFHDAGGYVPSYGKNVQTVLSKITLGGSKLNEKAMSAIDGNFRVGAFKSLTDGGMDPKEAAVTVNRFMGDRGVFKDAQPHMSMFMHYFVTMNKSAGSTIAQAFKGRPGALTNAAMAAAATYGLQKAWQGFTGNQGASVHAPGMVGIAKDYVKSANDLVHGQFRNAVNPLTNRINPIATQGAEQLLGVNNYGDKFKNGASRVDNALSMTPVTNVFNNNGHSIGEKVANTFGLYAPHVKGDMAVSANNPLAPVLNVKGAQSGATVAFPKDFTGEQNSKAVNNYLSATGTPYSSKTAATIANQTQSQQQATTNATKVLKQVGVTNATDIKKFAKLSAPDQQAYLDSVKALNSTGDTVSSSTIEKHLVANGKLGLAASLNNNIPGSLTQDDKNALENYAVAGNGDQRKVWLQDNNNAASYYQAEINRKAATNALSNEDKDTSGAWSGTGNTLAVKALVAKANKQFNVPQSLQQLYEDTTKSDYQNMSGAQKAELTQYAAQLNKNGVIDKFGIATGSSGGGGGSKSAFKAAGIPTGGSAVVKPSSDAGLKAGTAKYSPPTLAVAKPSTDRGGNPFIRSVSTSKGVK